MTTACLDSAAEWEEFARARSGDTAAWQSLVVRYQARLTAIALLITGSRQASEDVVQETFTRALNATIRDRDGTVRGFLGTIAYRLAVKDARHARRNSELDADEHIDPHPDPLEEILWNERDRAIVLAIRSLGEGQREALVLRCYGGHSYEEIAQVLEVPLGTAKSRVFYAVRACREILRNKGVLE